MEHRFGHQGFTLVELILTILLVSLLSAAAIPYAANLGHATTDAAVRKIASDISYARHLACNRSAIYGVSFDDGANRYSVVHYDPVSGTETEVTDPLTGSFMVIDFGTTLGLKDIDLKNSNFGGTAKVRFDSRGNPLSGTGVALTIVGSITVSDGGVSRSVQVQPNTGEVSLQ